MPKDYSPFTPGVPVPAERFAGKADEVRVLLARCEQARAGSLQCSFVMGERGAGKSSLCALVARKAERDLDLLTAHVFLGGVSTIEEACRRLFDEIARSSQQRPWFDRILKLFGKHLKEVGLFGVSVGFDATMEELRAIAHRLPDELHNLLDRLNDARKGLLIVFDDINGLAQSPQFANWLKSFIDQTSLRDPPLPVHLVLAGLPDRRKSLIALQPSLDRPFHLTETSLIQPEDAARFLRESFRNVGVEADGRAIDLLCDYAGGYPALLQEIGDAAFKADTDDRLDMDDASKGVVDAAYVVGQKYLQPAVFDAIRSDRYRSLLSTLASLTMRGEDEIRRKDVLDKLDDEQVRVFDNFIRKMKELDVIESPGHGVYRFKSVLHRLYYRMVASESENR